VYVQLSVSRDLEEAMTHTAALLQTTPNAPRYDPDALARCIDRCFDCSQACTACADACLGEERVSHLTRCISLNLTCADICAATGFVLSRQLDGDEGATRALLEACAQACASCAAECERHAEMHGHCRVCAEACRACEESCRELLASG
jgi:hypothetical protein